MASAFSLQENMPAARYKTLSSNSWAATGNTDTISDSRVKSNSQIVIEPTSAYVGRWYISSKSDGSFTITSSDVESAGTTYNYLIL